MIIQFYDQKKVISLSPSFNKMLGSGPISTPC